MDATGTNQTSRQMPVDQASELRKLAAGRETSANDVAFTAEQTQAARLILLARQVRENSEVAA